MRERREKFIFEMIRSVGDFREFMLPGRREQKLFVHRHHLSAEDRCLGRISHLDDDPDRVFLRPEDCPHRIRPVNGWRCMAMLLLD